MAADTLSRESVLYDFANLFFPQKNLPF
jgi:hypothetical protein